MGNVRIKKQNINEEEFVHQFRKLRVEERKFEESLVFLENAASNGNVHAMYELGLHFLHQNADRVRALELFERAAMASSLPRAMFRYGDLLIKTGKPREGLRYAKRAFESEDKFVQGLCFLNGIVVEKDRAEAFRLFSEAASDGSVESLKQLAQSFYFGWPKKDLKKAEMYFELAANQFYDPQCLEFLGEIFFEQKEFLKSHEKYTLAAEQNSRFAINSLKDPMFMSLVQHAKCRECVIALICCRKRKWECDFLFAQIPIQIVVCIARKLYETRDEICWKK